MVSIESDKSEKLKINSENIFVREKWKPKILWEM
jgi:hypothetical protein